MKTLAEICSNEYDTLESLKQLESELALLRMNGYMLFFRGEADVAYKLKPSIVRNYIYNRNVELKMLKEFKKLPKSMGGIKISFLLLMIICIIWEWQDILVSIHVC